MSGIESFACVESRAPSEVHGMENGGWYDDSERPEDVELPCSKSEVINEHPMYDDSERVSTENILPENPNLFMDNAEMGIDNISEGNNDIYKHCPMENGKWTDDRGNSEWIPESKYIPQKTNPENKTWEEILKEYVITGIMFKDGEPDFSEIIKGEVCIDSFSERRSDNFDKADISLSMHNNCTPEEIRQWRKNNGYTWHECRDMKTMQLVPSVVHNNLPHSGGIAQVKKGA